MFAPMMAKAPTTAAASPARKTAQPNSPSPAPLSASDERAARPQWNIGTLAVRAPSPQARVRAAEWSGEAPVQQTEPTLTPDRPPGPAWDFGKLPLAPARLASGLEGAALPGNIQRKLAIGAVDDPLEHEAMLRQLTDARTSRTEAPRDLFARAAQGPAGPLPYRQEMERAFGQSFHDVRAYAGGGAAESALQAMGAAGAAYDGCVAFQSATPTRELVAHELAHLVQAQESPPGTRRVSSAADSEREAQAAAARVVAGQTVTLTTLPPVGVFRSADTAAAAGKINGKIVAAQKQSDDARLEAISAALKAAQPAVDETASSTDHIVSLDGENLRVSMDDMQGLVAAVDAATHSVLEKDKPAPPAAAPSAPSVAQAGTPAPPGPARQPGVGEIEFEISAAEARKDETALLDLGRALQDANASAAPVSVVAIPFRGKAHQVEPDAIPDLITKVEAARDRLLAPSPAETPAPTSAGAAPATGPPSPSANLQQAIAQPPVSGPAAIAALQGVIAKAVQAQDKGKLEQIHANLLSAGEGARIADELGEASGGGPLRITVDGQTFDVAREEADDLAQQVVLATKQIGPGSIADKTAEAGIDVKELGASAHLPADVDLVRKLGGFITVQTVDGATVSLGITPRSLSITVSGVVVTTGPFQSARLGGATVDFPTGTIRIDASSSPTGAVAWIVAHFTAETIWGWLRGTPLADRGYNPIEDKDLEAHVSQIVANIKSSDKSSSDKPPVEPQDVSGVSLHATISLKKPFSKLEKGTGLEIQPDGPLNIEGHVEGTAAPLAKPGAPPAKVTSALISSDAISILADNKPVAKITGLSLTPAGVKITRVELLGTVKTMTTIESVARLAYAFLQLSQANTEVSTPELVDRALRNIDTEAKFVPYLTSNVLEGELTPQIQQALRDNPNLLPGLDLSPLAGAPSAK